MISFEEELQRMQLAQYLQSLATAVEKGHIVALEIKWSAENGKVIKSSLQLSKPIEFITVSLTV